MLKNTCYVIIMLFAICLVTFFSIKIYAYNLALKRFGNDVIFIRDVQNDFFASEYARSRIRCTRNFNDLSMLFIQIRAGGGYSNNHRYNFDPIYFGTIDKDYNVYYWSFRKMNYVKIGYKDGEEGGSTLYDVAAQAKECKGAMK